MSVVLSLYSPLNISELINQPLIMANDKQSARATTQRLLQRLNRQKIKMVSGLIQNQQVGFFHDTKRKQQFAQFARARLVTLKKLCWPRTQATNYRHHQPEISLTLRRA